MNYVTVVKNDVKKGARHTTHDRRLKKRVGKWEGQRLRNFVT
jgi:hypothetical protein